jgi:hypothetical protein
MTATVVRKFDRWSYPRNGNLSNPTPYFRWVPCIDGSPVSGGGPSMQREVEFLAEYFDIDSINVVREPLPANPYSQRTH